MMASNFSLFDGVLVVTYLVATVVVGGYVNRHIHGTADFLVGGRATGSALGVATLVGTELGLVTLMYAAMEGFARGPSYFVIPLLGLSVTMLLGSTGFVIGRLRRLRLTTIPEYFERRYRRRVRIAAGLLCAVAGILNMGLFPKMGATFIAYSTGLAVVSAPVDDLPPTNEATTNEAPKNDLEAESTNSEYVVNAITSLLIVLVVGYTVAGGMVAVIVTDYLQFVVLSVGLAIGTYFCLTAPELGWAGITETWVAERGHAAVDPTSADSYGWTYLIWQVVLIFAAGICWAPNATRALTTVDEATTRRTFFFAAPGMFARMAIPGLWGMAALVFVSQHAELRDYFSAAALEASPGRAAAAMPIFLGQLLPAGLLGLLTAGLLAAFMSTHDSYLLAWSSVISEDVVNPLRAAWGRKRLGGLWVTRASVVVIGGFLLVWGIWYQLPESVWTYMGVTGSIYLSGAAVALVGGMYWRRASSTGALLALGGGSLSLFGLFPVKCQTFVAERMHTDVEAVGDWLNDETIALSAYVVSAILFVVGSLVMPDAEPREPTPRGEGQTK